MFLSRIATPSPLGVPWVTSQLPWAHRRGQTKTTKMNNLTLLLIALVIGCVISWLCTRKKKNMNQFHRENFGPSLKKFVESHQGISYRQVAAGITCPEAVVHRIVYQKSWPTENLLRHGAIMMAVGFDKFANMTWAQREQISDALGTVGGGILGFATVSAVVSSFGISGLSAAGISSGLAAIGGTMITGIARVAIIPIAAAAGGYGLVRLVKWVSGELHLSSHQDVIDPYWEISRH